MFLDCKFFLCHQLLMPSMVPLINELMLQFLKASFFYHCLAGDIAGKVPVIIMTPDRNEVARTEYMYSKDWVDGLISRILTDEGSQIDLFHALDQRQCESQESGVNLTTNSAILGNENRIIVVLDQSFQPCSELNLLHDYMHLINFIEAHVGGYRRDMTSFNQEIP